MRVLESGLSDRPPFPLALGAGFRRLGSRVQLSCTARLWGLDTELEGFVAAITFSSAVQPIRSQDLRRRGPARQGEGTHQRKERAAGDCPSLLGATTPIPIPIPIQGHQGHRLEGGTRGLAERALAQSGSSSSGSSSSSTSLPLPERAQQQCAPAGNFAKVRNCSGQTDTRLHIHAVAASCWGPQRSQP